MFSATCGVWSWREKETVMKVFSCGRVACVTRGDTPSRCDHLQHLRTRGLASWLLVGVLAAVSMVASNGARADDETPVPAAAGYVVEDRKSVV